MNSVEISDLDSLLNRCGVKEIFPSKRELGITAALKQLPDLEVEGYPGNWRKSILKLADEIAQLGAQWNASCPPLVATTGLRNAGKSSLVKCFLSQAGRVRIPTGNASVFATRRYVFWVPEAWRSSSTQFQFEKMLDDVFGNPAELLSDDPVTSAAQYRDDAAGQGVRHPLIAYDRQLDDWQIGILDCPDIQTGDGLDTNRLTDAREMLAKAAMLCSAFIVVGREESVGEDVFWDIMRLVGDIGKEAELFLAVNKCSPKSSQEIVSEVEHIARQNHFELNRFHLYCSYDFTKRGAEKFRLQINDGRLPDGLAVGDEETNQFDRLLPAFFCHSSERPNPPESIEVERLLVSALRQVPSDGLKCQFQSRMAGDLCGLIDESMKMIDMANKYIRASMNDCYHGLADALLRSMADQGVARPLQNESLVERQEQLMIKEAPFTIGASKWINKQLTWLVSAVVDQINQALFGNANRMVNKGRIILQKQGKKVTSDAVARQICESHQCRLLVNNHSQGTIEAWVKDAFLSFGHEFKDDLESLRPLYKKYYAEMSWYNYAWAHVWATATLATLLVAALFIVVDGGATLYGVSAFEGLLIASGVVGAQLAQSLIEVRAAEKPLIESQVAFLVDRLSASAGIPPGKLAGEFVTVKRGEDEYKIELVKNAAASLSGKTPLFKSNHDLAKRVIDSLKQIRAT